MSRLLPVLLLALPLPAFAADGGSDATMVLAFLALLVGATGALLVVRRGLGLAVGAASGIVVAGWLTVQHHRAEAGIASVCNINSTWNCDVVNTSRWSEIGGIPIALLGVGYFAAVTFLAVRALTGRAPHAMGAILALGALATAYDVFLAWAMLGLGSYCVLCITTWILNLLILVGAALEVRAQPMPFGQLLWAGVKESADYAALVGVAAVVLGGMALRGAAPPKALSPAQGGDVADLRQYLEQPAGEILLDGTEPVYGDAAARFTLVEFADYECPHCGLMATQLKEVLAENKDVKLLFKHYPLSPACNRFAPGGRHENACNAAAAAECARLQGRFWEINAQMFQNQEYLGKDDLRFMAKQVGLDLAAFETCMGDAATAQAVIADVEAGGAAQIDGTPSIFAKGLYGDRWVKLTAGNKDAINAVLAAARDGVALPEPMPPHQD